MYGPDNARFQSGAEKYATYLETPEGRLRLDLALANLQEFLPQEVRPLSALDIGGGSGAMGVRLAKLGIQVTLLDSSIAMLEFAERAAQETGVAERITLKHGDAMQLNSLLPRQNFGVILCHNVLEYLDDPCGVLRDSAHFLRDPASIISVLVRNRAGEVLRAAIKDGDLPAAEVNLTAEWGQEALYGGRVRLFAGQTLQTIISSASLEVVARRGVRVISDYLPGSVSRDEDYQRIFQLEGKLGRRPEFTAIARYVQYLARRAGPAVSQNT
jgi:S-adenosylmethionine-dependent methyltransferase